MSAKNCLIDSTLTIYEQLFETTLNIHAFYTHEPDIGHYFIVEDNDESLYEQK